jgi:hypothetical protein
MPVHIIFLDLIILTVQYQVTDTIYEVSRYVFFDFQFPELGPKAPCSKKTLSVCKVKLVSAYIINTPCRSMNCLIKHHAMNTYWGSAGMAPHIPNLGSR